MNHFADRLMGAVRTKGNALCVGLDPRWEMLPQALQARHADGSLVGVARAYEEFCGRVLEIVAPLSSRNETPRIVRPSQTRSMVSGCLILWIPS